MKKQKFLIITKEDISSWKSCQLITSNLLKSYVHSFSAAEFTFLKAEEYLSYYQAHSHALKIKESKVDTIVWLDHKPCAAKVLMALSEIYSDTPHELRPKFLVHLFGDFILDCREWQQAEQAINRYPVHFFAASDKQKMIVDKMFVSQKNISSVVPFPVDVENYSVKNLAANRNEIRNSFGLNDELILIYTGRISFQKNVEAFVNAVTKIRTVIDKKIEVWIAGPWDDILLPYYGMGGMPGSHFSQFHSNLIDKTLSGVRFLGNLNSEDLEKHYHAADAFVSFSTYNDEDYGMSVAEAMMTGLPCVLSDWGGFSSFANYSGEVELVPVQHNGSRMMVNTQLAQAKILKKAIQILEKEFNKDKVARVAAENLSVESVGLRIKNLFENLNYNNDVKFSGLFHRLCSSFQVNPLAPFKSNNRIYNEVYGDYAISKF